MNLTVDGMAQHITYRCGCSTQDRLVVVGSGVGEAYGGAKEDVVSAFNAQHERVVLVADLVLVGPETPARPDPLFPQPGECLVQHGIAPQAGSWVPVLQPSGPTACSRVLIPI